MRRQSRPGVHGKARRALSEYGRELLERQRLRFAYGLGGRSLKRYMKQAKLGGSDAGSELLRLLERRLDNTIMRSGLASSRREARLLIRHGHFLLNEKPVRSPGLLISPGDVLRLRDASAGRTLFRDRSEQIASHELPAWLSVSAQPLAVKVERLPTHEELVSQPIDTRLVVEYYSR